MARVVRSGEGIEVMKLRVKELEKLNLFVGWLESAKYDGGTPVAGVAAVHEYGSPKMNIPPRPFMRPAIADNKSEWLKIIEQGARAIINGKSTANQVLELLGLKASGDVKVAIKNVTEPSLQAETVASKARKKADGKTIGSLNKPLVEEAIMINSVTYEVK